MTSTRTVSGAVGQLYVASLMSRWETRTRFMSIVTKTRAARTPVTAKLFRSVPCVYSARTPVPARYFQGEYTSAIVTSVNAITASVVVYQNRPSARQPSCEMSAAGSHEKGHLCISDPSLGANDRGTGTQFKPSRRNRPAGGRNEIETQSQNWSRISATTRGGLP